MAKTIRVLFDGEVLRPEQPVDLQPNSRYLVTIEDEEPMSTDDSADIYPLTQIGRLATDMGVTDLSVRHNAYAHDRVPDVEDNV